MSTWADLRTQVCMRLDADEDLVKSGGGMWTDEELRFWAYDGLKDIAQRLLVHRDVKSYDLVADQAEYDMPADMVKLYRVEYRSDSSYIRPLEYAPLAEFDGIRGVLRSSGWTGAYTTWGYPGGGGQIILDRAPSDDIADGLRVYYYRLPREMSDDSDPVDIPAGWERIVSYYVEAQARRKEQTDQRWRDAMQLYEAGLKDMERAAAQHSDQQTFITDVQHGYASQIFGSEW